MSAASKWYTNKQQEQKKFKFKNEDSCLLDCSTVKSGRCLLIALIMEAAKTSETSVNFYRATWLYNPEDGHLRTHSRDNVKSYLTWKVTEPNLEAIRIQPGAPTHNITIQWQELQILRWNVYKFHRLDDRGSTPSRSTGCRPTVGTLTASTDTKRLGGESDHAPPSNSKIKNAWSYNSTPQFARPDA
jgi:hypothetical protein